MPMPRSNALPFTNQKPKLDAAALMRDGTQAIFQIMCN